MLVQNQEINLEVSFFFFVFRSKWEDFDIVADWWDSFILNLNEYCEKAIIS